MDPKLGGFIEHWSIVAVEFIKKKKSVDDFWFNRCFRESSLWKKKMRFRANVIVMSLSRDIYSDRPKNNIIITLKSMCNTFVIMVLQ